MPDAVSLVDRELGLGIATPNHVLTVAAHARVAAQATEPEPAYAGTEPYPSVCHGNGGEGVLIYMADTGLLADPAHGHPWLKGVREGDAGRPGSGEWPGPDPGRIPGTARSSPGWPAVWPPRPR